MSLNEEAKASRNGFPARLEARLEVGAMNHAIEHVVHQAPAFGDASNEVGSTQPRRHVFRRQRIDDAYPAEPRPLWRGRRFVGEHGPLDRCPLGAITLEL